MLQRQWARSMTQRNVMNHTGRYAFKAAAPPKISSSGQLTSWRGSPNSQHHANAPYVASSKEKQPAAGLLMPSKNTLQLAYSAQHWVMLVSPRCLHRHEVPPQTRGASTDMHKRRRAQSTTRTRLQVAGMSRRHESGAICAPLPACLHVAIHQSPFRVMF